MPKLTIRFSDHMAANRVRDMSSSIAAYGNVYADEAGRELAVEVFRPAKLPQLKEQRTKWETAGFLKWHELEA
jgi:hypothetical protein